MKQDWGLVIDYCWPVYNDGRLVIDYWAAMDYEGSAVYHDIGSVIHLGRWVVDNRWTLDQD